jgi:hypothetical protein
MEDDKAETICVLSWILGVSPPMCRIVMAVGRNDQSIVWLWFLPFRQKGEARE